MTPLARQVLERLTQTVDHAQFRGPPLDVTALTPLELGWLWPRVEHARHRPENPVAYELANAVVTHVRRSDISPAFDGETCLPAFASLDARQRDKAIEYLSYLTCEPPTTLVPELARFVGDVTAETRYKSFDEHYKPAVLMRFVDAATRAAFREAVLASHPDAPYLLAEFEVLEHLSLAAALALALPGYVSYYWPANEHAGPDVAIALANEPAYVEFAARALANARARLAGIHAGEVPYVADAAFVAGDAHIIARAARIAAHIDAPWFGEIIATLLPHACVAPTSAKTCPSQALAVALGHSIQGVPTPEAVQALRAASAVVRHAGVKKKLSRNLRPAERGLAERPELALRVPIEGKPTKRQLTTLASALEAGYWLGTTFSFEDWRTRLALSPVLAPLARSLLWRARSDGEPATTFLLEPSTDRVAAVDVTGRSRAISQSSLISLWHPLDTDEAERNAWRSVIHAREMRQPIRQAYREFYVPAADESEAQSSGLFTGYTLSIVPLIGLARREGWQLEKQGGLLRDFGGVRVCFDVAADLYPGAQGSGESGELRFFRRQAKSWEWMALRDVPPILFSEACRAVDLLVSVTSFALDDSRNAEPLTVGDLGVTFAGDPSPPPGRPLHPRVARLRRLAYLTDLRVGDMAQTRREVLQRVFADEIATGRLAVDARRITIGTFAINLATARVTDNGTPIEIELPDEKSKLAALPWLPYDEKLLEKIVRTAGALLSR